jgi:hypothetical protein
MNPGNLRVPSTPSAASGRPATPVIAALTAAAIAGAVLPVLAALAFLISLAAQQPLIAVAAGRWSWLSQGPAGSQTGPSHRTLTALTVLWGVAMLAAGAVQAAGAVTGGLSLTRPSGFAARALIALAAEAILAAITIVSLRFRPVPGRQATRP